MDSEVFLGPIANCELAQKFQIAAHSSHVALQYEFHNFHPKLYLPPSSILHIMSLKKSFKTRPKFSNYFLRCTHKTVYTPSYYLLHTPKLYYIFSLPHEKDEWVLPGDFQTPRFSVPFISLTLCHSLHHYSFSSSPLYCYVFLFLFTHVQRNNPCSTLQSIILYCLQ
jgi:hypothetical protein